MANIESSVQRSDKNPWNGATVKINYKQITKYASASAVVKHDLNRQNLWSVQIQSDPLSFDTNRGALQIEFLNVKPQTLMLMLLQKQPKWTGSIYC